MATVIREDGGTTVFDLTGQGVPVLLAPGAGAGRAHPFMTGMRDRLVDRGLAVATFDYPYREEGRAAPDRLPRLVSCHTAVARAVAEVFGQAPWLVGKSMGGRVGSHCEVPTPGRVFLGYPLVPAGKTAPRDTSHLSGLGPMLFVTGDRDALAPLGLITGLVAGLPQAELAIVAGADHGFRIPVRSGVDPEKTLDHLADLTAGWIRRWRART